MMLLYSVSSLALFAVVVAITTATNLTCYYPNGLKNNGGPCNANAEVSVCCGPTFVCLSNGLCRPGSDTRRTYAYEFYRSGCTDASFNSSSCPRICIGPGFNKDRGQGIKKCGDDTYCCGGSGDCCSDSANIFSLEAASAIATITPSSDYSTSVLVDSTSTTSTLISEPVPKKDHSNRLAIGLGVGVSVGGLLLIALTVSHFLNRRFKAKANADFKPKEDVSELDASSTVQSPDCSTSKAGYAVTESGVVHEMASGRNGIPVGVQELAAHTTYDWEPRDEPQPRDGGFRPEDPSEH